MDNLNSISPIDGRYQDKVAELSNYFSEFALMRYRLLVEIEYLIALSHEPSVEELPAFNEGQQAELRSLYQKFNLEDAKKIKEIEDTTHHDVKAVEYFLQEKFKGTNYEKTIPFIHFALTSEDVNNLSYTLMWKHSLEKVFLFSLVQLQDELKHFAKENADQPMLSLTHGQSATPTTVGKEIAVFVYRLSRQLKQFETHKFLGKFGGATGTWSAELIAYPNVDWFSLSKKFVQSLGLEFNPLTTQIESHDSLIESYQTLQRTNNILKDFCGDVWLYISRGIMVQKKKEGEIGSSTMPHKINPIYFENAEGNLGISTSLLSHLANKLPISRMQRDLTDSTVLRNQGIAMAHSLLAIKSILTGLERLVVNKAKLEQELDENWEVLAEAIQVVLRKCGQTNAYEQMKELTRGNKITQIDLQNFINKLNIPAEEKQKLLNLTPQTYTGLASKSTKAL